LSESPSLINAIEGRTHAYTHDNFKLDYIKAMVLYLKHDYKKNVSLFKSPL